MRLQVIGDPVLHSKSPVIQGAMLAALGRKDVAYTARVVRRGELPDYLAWAKENAVAGFNATMPHKEDLLPLMDELDDAARAIGSVNTVCLRDGMLCGHSTDGPGFLDALENELHISPTGRTIILLGAGGAARAAAFLCAEKGAEKVYLLNRSLDKAKQLADEVNGAFDRECIFPMGMADYEKLPEEKLLVLQGTSVGLHPDVDQAPIRDMEFYRRVHTGYDLIYKPAETMFMKLVREAGGKAYNGLSMLLYQGIIAYELWNQVEVTKEDADEIYEIMKAATAV